MSPNQHISHSRRIAHRLRYTPAALILSAATAIVGAPVVHASPVCTPATVTIATAARVPLLDWSENLTVDSDGNLWVSRLYRNTVERFDPEGNRTASIPVTKPGAIRLGPDGLLYVNFGNTHASNLLRTGGVLRFDPRATAPVPEVFVDQIGMANGAAFDKDGYLYITDTGGGIIRVRRDGTIDTEWTAQAPQNFGFNGIVAHGDALYVSLLPSLTARVLRVPIADPTHPTVVAELAPEPLTGALLPDDLIMGPDEMLYIATATGRLVRVDPTHGTPCTVATTQPITALTRIPDAAQSVFAGTEGGDVLRISLPA